MIREIMGKNGSENKNIKHKNNPNKECKRLELTPSQLLVISGILANVLEVESILLDKDQTVQILLTGTLKRETQLEKIMDQIGCMPFDKVLKTMVDRL